MTIEYYVPEWMLKRAAKRLSKQIDITHLEALDEFAFELGFQDWKELKEKEVTVRRKKIRKIGYMKLVKK